MKKLAINLLTRLFSRKTKFTKSGAGYMGWSIPTAADLEKHKLPRERRWRVKFDSEP